jgi:hypothetical protein
VTFRFNGAAHGGPAPYYRYVLHAPATAQGSFKIEAATLSADTTIAAHAANYWTMGLQVGTVTTFESISSTALATSSAAITANTVYTVPVDGPEASTPKKVFLAAGDVVRLSFVAATTSSADLTNVGFNLILWLRHSPPGR